MKKVFFALLFALSLLATNGMQAQNEYDNALGLRLGLQRSNFQAFYER